MKPRYHVSVALKRLAQANGTHPLSEELSDRLLFLRSLEVATQVFASCCHLGLMTLRPVHFFVRQRTSERLTTFRPLEFQYE